MPITEFIDNFLVTVLEKLSKENKTCILMGDFNINLLKHASNNVINQFYGLMCSHYFSAYILQPTRITDESKTLIDNIFLNTLEYARFSGNLTTKITDHLIQFVILDNCYTRKKSNTIKTEKYKKKTLNFFTPKNLLKIY